MNRQLRDLISEKDIQDFRMFLYELWNRKNENQYLLRNEILLQFEEFCAKHEKQLLCDKNSSVKKLLQQTPELILSDHLAVLVHRYQMAKYRLYRIALNRDEVEQITVRELLDLRDKFVDPGADENADKLRLDFLPFYDYGPTISDVKSVGRGIQHLNRYMSSSLFQNPQKWNTHLFEFLKIHSLGDQQLLINGASASDYEELVATLEEMTEYLAGLDPETSHLEVMPTLKRHGFESGWGDTVGRIRETMQLLLDLFQSPDSQNLEKFISRIPMISKIAIISPHGWFGQDGVLGKPDTGGQVVYILDQVRAIEKTLQNRLLHYGLETTPKIIVLTRLIPEAEGTSCNQRLEKIHHTENCWILRIPFRDARGNILPHWISRFEVWPYLHRFAAEAKKELQGEFSGRPDLFIGNYSDGNLVATLLSGELGVIQCNIAHALEKTKYIFSDLYWHNLEDNYHFSLQFLADLIAMNMADFIITSTFQEIAGTQHTRGQYESYQFFTMPGYLQVENGINLFHPKFNVIPPGVDIETFFPYSQNKRRLPNRTERLSHMLFVEEDAETVGRLDDAAKTPILTMARLDKVKNLTALVESFGQSAELQERCNLIVIAGRVDATQSSDAEEIAEINRMYELIRHYQIWGKIRWLGKHLTKEDTGETYRIIADRKGIFIQPARFEAFGLTVIEAMASGLPVLATQFGGPSEIIIDNDSGFLINPTVPELISRVLLEFLNKVETIPQYWQQISDNAIQRVAAQFTWELYSNKLLNLTKLYGFWRYSVSNIGRRELEHYTHLLLQLLFLPKARALEQKHGH